jgi:chemotaxis protein MotB
LLTNTYAVDPTRVTASGRSYFEPVDSNSTPEGRQRNRRTEIILAPKLDQILQLLEQSKAASENRYELMKSDIGILRYWILKLAM